jgi:urease accessory protein
MLHAINKENTTSQVVSPAARVGIGGPVGSGKTALIEALIPVLQRRGVDLAVVTNDLVTKEDAERLRRSGLIDPSRVSAVEAGACPHTVIREDPTLNIAAGDDLEARFPGVELILFESGGDNLASTFSLDLVDWWMFVIDVAGGDDIPRKRGPGLLRCDLLVVNKIDLAPHVGVELAPMLAEAERVRAGRPVIATNARSGVGVEAVDDAILATSRAHFNSTGCGRISRRCIFSRHPAGSMPRTGWPLILSSALALRSILPRRHRRSCMTREGRLRPCASR